MDPNCTHAWNALVQGHKKWVMYPPATRPPGVSPSPDGGEVAQPISLMEWFLNFYEYAQRECPPVEFVAKPGDVVFVPSGWWHCVLNLDHTVAVTQNYLAASNINRALVVFRDRQHLISGLKREGDVESLFTRLMRRLQASHPKLITEVSTALRGARHWPWPFLCARAGTSHSPQFHAFDERLHRKSAVMRSMEAKAEGGFRFAFQP